mgnify:CR=1 FL=1
MARPSMAAQRKEEILDALEICILESGIQATSLENIAEKAGVKRTILRHYIGNRDDIIVALSQRWRDIYSAQWQEIISWLPTESKGDALIDSLFTIGSKDMIDGTIIGEAIFSEAKRLPEVKAHQEKTMSDFICHLTNIFSKEYPDANADSIELVCHGIYANYLLAQSFLPIKMVDQVHKLKRSSKLLCTTLTQQE